MQNYVYLLGRPEHARAAVVDAAGTVDAVVRSAEADGTASEGSGHHFHADRLAGAHGHQIIGAAEAGGARAAKGLHPQGTSCAFVQPL